MEAVCEGERGPEQVEACTELSAVAQRLCRREGSGFAFIGPNFEFFIVPEFGCNEIGGGGTQEPTGPGGRDGGGGRGLRVGLIDPGGRGDVALASITTVEADGGAQGRDRDGSRPVRREATGQPSRLARTGQPSRLARTGQPSRLARTGQPSRLARTGQESWLAAVVGVLLLAAGLGLRRRFGLRSV